MDRFNIIYFHSHDTGRCLEPYGHPVPTPAFNRLAQEGVLFRQAFCAAPTCSPSRAALLTGMWPHQTGMLGLAHPPFHFKLNDYRQTLIHTLRGAGYFTLLAGAQHISSDAGHIGYDQVFKPRDKQIANVLPAALDWLKQTPRQPFFMDLGFAETHRPFPLAGPAFDPRYTTPLGTIPDSPDTRMDAAQFHQSIAHLDHALAQVLDMLDRTGLASRTLLIATTDHGPAFPGMKCNLTDLGLGVYLLMRGPGDFTGGKVCDAMVSHTDLFPTLCDCLGVQPPARLVGKSLMPLMRNPVDQLHEELFGEVTFHAAYEPMRSVRTKGWKYIRRFGQRETPVRVNTDKGYSKTAWVNAGWLDRPHPREALYDLALDPREGNNLANDLRHGSILVQMRRRLDDFMSRTADPLLAGDVSPPSGCQLRDPDIDHG